MESEMVKGTIQRRKEENRRGGVKNKWDRTDE